MVESPKTKIKLNVIRLVSSLFEWPSSLKGLKIDNVHVDLKTNYEIRDHFLAVTLNVCLKNESEDSNEDLYLEVEMIGIFESANANQVFYENFVEEHAVKIIFPYIRQHIRVISLDEGFEPIILPSIKLHHF